MPNSSRPEATRADDSAQGGAVPEPLSTANQIAAAAGLLGSEPILAFDTEFLRERTFYPELGLVQIAGRERSYVVDPLAVDAAGMAPILELLTRPDILKVAHAVEQDQECLHHVYGVVAAPLLDTAIAAALTGRGEQIGLVHLLRKLLDIHLPKTHSRANWTQRPLSDEMLRYALADVDHLVEAAEILLEDLDKTGRREWAMRLSAEFGDRERFQPQPEALAARMASSGRLRRADYAVLIELVRWREQRVRRSNLPRRWIAEDTLLMRLSRAKPRNVKALSNIGGLNAKIVSQRGEEILAAIERGRETVGETPDPPEKLEAEPEEVAALNVLKCYLGLLAHDRRVPLRYLVDSDAALLLLRENPSDLEALRGCGLISEGAIELFGEEIVELLQGRRAMRIENGQVVRFDPNGRETEE